MPSVIIRAMLEATNNVAGLVSDAVTPRAGECSDDPRVLSLAVTLFTVFVIDSDTKDAKIKRRKQTCEKKSVDVAA